MNNVKNIFDIFLQSNEDIKKDIPCNTCVCEDVCRYKNEYLGLVENLAIYFDDISESFVEFVPPRCVHYVPKTIRECLEERGLLK